MILIMVCTLEKNYFLVCTKLRCLWYSVFLNVPMNHIRKRNKERKLIVKEKSIILSQLLFNCNTEKTKIMIFYNFVFWAYIYFGQRHLFLISFIFKYMSRSWTDKSETLGKLSNHQNLWWKCCGILSWLVKIKLLRNLRL